MGLADGCIPCGQGRVNRHGARSFVADMNFLECDRHTFMWGSRALEVFDMKKYVGWRVKAADESKGALAVPADDFSLLFHEFRDGFWVESSTVCA